jgi:hypothetical protein
MRSQLIKLRCVVQVGYLPRLSWFSMASCPAALAAPPPHKEVEVVTMDALRLGKVLKAGANGVVHWAKMADKQVRDSRGVWLQNPLVFLRPFW